MDLRILMRVIKPEPHISVSFNVELKHQCVCEIMLWYTVRCVTHIGFNKC